MLGAIIGDIVGSRFEFNNTDNYNFELFTEESTFTNGVENIQTLKEHTEAALHVG